MKDMAQYLSSVASKAKEMQSTGEPFPERWMSGMVKALASILTLGRGLVRFGAGWGFAVGIL